MKWEFVEPGIWMFRASKATCFVLEGGDWIVYRNDTTDVIAKGNENSVEEAKESAEIISRI